VLPAAPTHNSILIIDDDVMEIRLLSEMLRDEGYRLFAALNGEDGFRRALEHRPGLILLDLNMPGLDGHATARLMAGDPRLTNVPIIFLTGSAELSDKLDAFAEGAVDYITKPFSADEVAARLRVHLRRAPSQPAPGSEPGAPREAPAGERLVLKAQELLLSRLAQPLSLTELAHEVGTNERRLTEEFRRYTGKAVFEYLRGERHRVACEMLLHTDKPVSTIAEATGFNATAAFTYAFRQRCGLTPSQFRASGGILAGPYPDGDARDGEEVQGAGS
jgi:DNA-binding response OmpR family regulator